MEENLADELEFETQTDILTLLENVKCQGANQSGLKQAFLALSTICSSNVESQDYFRLAGGVRDVSTLLEEDSCPLPAVPAALFCLACAVKKNGVSQNLVLNKQFLEVVQQLLASDDEKIVNSAAFLLACAVAYNGRGQQLAEETGCLKELLNILRRYLCDGQANDSQWLVITKAVAICVNNPQNERNQGICCSVLPLALKFLSCGSEEPLNSGLRHVLALISWLVANNTPNQNRLRQCGGLEELVKLIKMLEGYPADSRMSTSVFAITTLDACIADNASSGIEAGNMGMISVILKLVIDFDWEPADLKPLLLTVAHILESHEKFSRCIMESKAYDQLVKLLTSSQDEELFKILKYIFTLCRAKDETDPQEPDGLNLGQITRNWMETMNEKMGGLLAMLQSENLSMETCITENNPTFTYQQKLLSNLNSKYGKHTEDHDLQPNDRHVRETLGHKKQTTDPCFPGMKYSESSREDAGSHAIRRFEQHGQGKKRSYTPPSSRSTSEQEPRAAQMSLCCQAFSTAGDNSFTDSGVIHKQYFSNTSDDQTTREYAVFKPTDRRTSTHATIKENQIFGRNQASLNCEKQSKEYPCPTHQAEVSNGYDRERYLREEGEARDCIRFVNHDDYRQQNMCSNVGLMGPNRSVLRDPNSSCTQTNARSQCNHLDKGCETLPAGNCLLYHSSDRAQYNPVLPKNNEGQDRLCYQSPRERWKTPQSCEQPLPTNTYGDFNGNISINHPYSCNISTDNSYHNSHGNLGNCNFNNYMHRNINDAYSGSANNLNASHNINDRSNLKVDSGRYDTCATHSSHLTFNDSRNNNCVTPVRGNQNNNSCFIYASSNHGNNENNRTISHTPRGNLDFNSERSFACENRYSNESPTQSTNNHIPQSNSSNGNTGMGTLYERQLDLLKHFQAMSTSLKSYISGAVSSKQTVGNTSQAEWTADIASDSAQHSPMQEQAKATASHSRSQSPSSGPRSNTKDASVSPSGKDSSCDSSPEHNSTAPDYFLDNNTQNKSRHVKNILPTISQSNDSLKVIKDNTGYKEQDGLQRRNDTNIDNEIVKTVATGTKSNEGSHEHGFPAVQPTQPEKRTFVKPSGAPRKPRNGLRTPTIRHAGTPQSHSVNTRMKLTPSLSKPGILERSFTQPPPSPALSEFDLNLQEIAQNRKNSARLTKSPSVSSAIAFTTPRKTHAVPVKNLKRSTTPQFPLNLMEAKNVVRPKTSYHSDTSEMSSGNSESPPIDSQLDQKIEGKMTVPLYAHDAHQPVSTSHSLNSVCLQDHENETKSFPQPAITSAGSVNEVNLSKGDIVKQCPGCAPGQSLNSRTFNIAIETNPNTCLYHRAVRRVERDEIKKQLKSLENSGTRSFKDVEDDPPSSKRKESDVYQYSLSSESEEILSSPCRDETMSTVQAALTKRALKKGCLGEVRRPRVPYSDEEVANLKEGVRKIGRHWQQILYTYNFHPSRTSIDLKDKYRKLNKPLKNETKEPGRAIPFSMCEIRRLKRGVKMFGYNWKAILAGSKFLPGRTARALRDKWKLLNKVDCNQ